jgi:peroxiredoxin Q/BCP
MYEQSLAVAAAAVLLLAAGACASTAKADLKAGDAAPAFELQGSDGKVHRLADHVGKRAVVLAWFPKAFTGG